MSFPDPFFLLSCLIQHSCSNGHPANQRRELLFSSFLFSSDPIHLAAAPLLDPSEGAARNRHLGRQKGQNFTVCQLCALWSYPGKTVYLNILGRAFYFSDWNVAHCLSFSLTFFIPPVLCQHLLSAFPASYLNLFAKPTPFFIAAALLFETGKFQV